MRATEGISTTITGVAKRNRSSAKPSRAGGTGTNVIALPRRISSAEAIAADTLASSEMQESLLLGQMRELGALLKAQHRARAQELLPLALKMDRPMLDSFIEIGQRLLAGWARA